jgi:hypothetical protein
MLGLIAIVGAVLIGRVDASASHSAREEHNRQVLTEAKDALIGAMLRYYDENPSRAGLLPCPDLDTGGVEGSSNGSNCGNRNANTLGRLPWRTLGTGPLRDADGECLWYAVSGPYKMGIPGSSMTGMLNADSLGAFRVAELRVNAQTGARSFFQVAGGTAGSPAPQDRAVAVIIAPGAELASNATRNFASGTVCGEDFNTNAYLEAWDEPAGGPLEYDNPGILTGNAFEIASLITQPLRVSFENDRQRGSLDQLNDRMVVITREDIWQAVFRHNGTNHSGTLQQRLEALTQILAGCVAWLGNTVDSHAGGRHTPWATDLLMGDYTDDDGYVDRPDSVTSVPVRPDEEAGRFPERICETNRELAGVGEMANACGSYDTTRLVSDCYLVGPDELHLWQNWKDHYFLSTEDEREPDDDGVCGTCLSVDGSSPVYQAVVFFAGERLPDQTRIGPEFGDINTKDQASNYLEGAGYLQGSSPGQNATTLQQAAGSSEAYSTAPGNDVLWCVRGGSTVPPDPLTVELCP